MSKVRKRLRERKLTKKLYAKEREMQVRNQPNTVRIKHDFGFKCMYPERLTLYNDLHRLYIDAHRDLHRDSVVVPKNHSLFRLEVIGNGN